MQLSFCDLRKKDVINVADGRCLGRIIDLTLKFPQGILTGITVPGRRIYGFRLFDRSQVFIDESKILKIGGDVILVNINCGDVCLPNSNPTPPPKPKHKGQGGGNCFPTCEELFGNDRIDTSDY